MSVGGVVMNKETKQKIKTFVEQLLKSEYREKVENLAKKENSRVLSYYRRKLSGK